MPKVYVIFKGSLSKAREVVKNLEKVMIKSLMKGSYQKITIFGQ